MNEEDILRHKGVKATPNRILVARELLRAESPLSLSQLEERLSTVDKSSIFRVLNLFALSTCTYISIARSVTAHSVSTTCLCPRWLIRRDSR